MAFLLRKIRKAKWYKHQGVSWLGEGELQADALEDMTTKGLLALLQAVNCILLHVNI